MARALAEDVGDGDVTTAATVPAGARGRALITQKAPGVVYGLDVGGETFRVLDPAIAFDRLVAEGNGARRRRPAARGLGPRDADRASGRR